MNLLEKMRKRTSLDVHTFRMTFNGIDDNDIDNVNIM